MKIQAKCPECGGTGQVLRVSNTTTTLKMECTECAAKWNSNQGQCPECGCPNEYPVDGLCKFCYEELYSQKRQKDKKKGSSGSHQKSA